MRLIGGLNDFHYLDRRSPCSNPDVMMVLGDYPIDASANEVELYEMHLVQDAQSGFACALNQPLVAELLGAILILEDNIIWSDGAPSADSLLSLPEIGGSR